MVRWLLVAAFLAAGLLALHAAAPAPADDSLTMLDVGQGDSVVIDGGLAVMVDTGSRGKGALESSRAHGHLPRALIITHLHEDHAGDAASVIAAHPAAVFWNGRTDGPTYAAIRDAAERAGVPLVALAPSDLLHAGDALVRVLGPDVAYRTSDDPNDTSLAIRVELPGFSALMTGDLNLEGEAALPAAYLDADVLKVGHHGSKTSSGEAFLAAVSPQVALISVGAGNRYGHPTAEALSRLHAAGAQVYRTDEAGTLEVRAQGGKLLVSR